MTDSGVMPPLYDVEKGLREVARARRRRDEATVVTADIAERLATHLTRHFGHEALETAGIALVITAASSAYVATECKDNIAQTVVNIIAFAGQRMVLDARAAEDPSTTSTSPHQTQEQQK